MAGPSQHFARGLLADPYLLDRIIETYRSALADR
jgi:hypothetical protein